MESSAAPLPSLGSPATPPIRTNLALLGMVVIWAVNFSVVKEALNDVSPLAFNALRFPFAAVVVYVAMRRGGAIARPRGNDTWRMVGLGLLGNVIYQQLFIFGLENTMAGTASVLLAGTPILTAVFSSAAGHERLRRGVWVGVAATFLGIVLVVNGNPATAGDGGHRLLGDLLLIGATLAWASYTVAARPLIHRYGAAPVTAWTLWVGTIGIMLVGLPDLLRMDLRSLHPATWGAVLYAGALSIGLAYLIWAQGVRHIGNTRTSAYSNLVPVIALVVAWMWLGEIPGPGQIAGAAVIIGGVTLAQLAH